MGHEQRECRVLERAQRGATQDQFAKAAGQMGIDDPEEIFMPVGAHRIDLYQGEGQIV